MLHQNKMIQKKISDLVIKALVHNDVSHAFVISGGASLHLIHSVAENPKIRFICPQHEQAAAMAADSFSRVSKKMGCAIATSGPGATNLVTGIAAAYYDSVPVLYLTGNVATFRAKGNIGVRQLGFQETEFIEMCKTITKYSVLVNDPAMTVYEIEKAIHIARSDRPGPVLVDIPDDIQRALINPKKVIHFSKPLKKIGQKKSYISSIKKILKCLESAKRPVLLLGWGVHLSQSESFAVELINRLKIPTVMTWAALDTLPFNHKFNFGGFGTHGVRYANYTVQNADFILSIGARLDTKATGSPASTFAREAIISMVDIDKTEINKFKKLGRKIDIPIQCDVKIFIPKLLSSLKSAIIPNYNAWFQTAQKWKFRYPALLPEFEKEKSINPYVFVDQLSDILQEGEVIICETGCALAWMMQGFKFKKRQRFYHAFNYTPMGYGLPAAIGASFAKPGKRIICITGDGSLQMNLQELSTITYHNLPIKIILINNSGHGMVQQTQEQWLKGKYYATSIEGGLGFPDFVAVAKAYGFPVGSIKHRSQIKNTLLKCINKKSFYFLNVEIKSSARVIPLVQYGRPNEDSCPLLQRSEFLSNMLIKPLPVSISE